MENASRRYTYDRVRKMVEERKKEYEDKYNAKIVVLKCQPYEVSSTLIRSMITEGKDISRYVPESVCEYIKRYHGNK